MKKTICSVLALLMAISPLSTFALTDAPIVPPGTTPVTLNTTPLTFNATVPTGLPLDLAANGVVTPATEASIINNSIGPIKVVSITTTSVKDWVLTSYTDDFSTKKVNSKDIALQFNKDNVQSSGGIALTPQNWPTIAGSDSLRLDYQGKLAPQSTGFTADTAANVSFVLDWDSSTSTPEPPVDKYVMATDEDFSGTKDGEFKYIGTDNFVEIPHIIKGVPVTSYSHMFGNDLFETTSVEGVKSTNTNITDMNSMFYFSKATTLDLSKFDTSNVTNMSQMFSHSQATTIDLSNFNTSKVTNMSHMFGFSKAKALDLSGFDTSNVTAMYGMFSHSEATTLDVSNFDTSSVNNMADMFYNCKATELDVSSFDTSNVMAMSQMFAGLPVTELNLSSFTTSNVTTMYAMFRNSQVTELDLSSFNTSNVNNIIKMFEGSLATTGYARTQTDADNFNASDTGKPSTLTFRVK